MPIADPTKLALVAVLALSAVACGKSKATAPPTSETETTGADMASTIAVSMVKDEFKLAKAAFDKGEDPNCSIDTSELRKSSSAEAKQLAKDVDKLCEVDAPPRRLTKRLTDGLESVTESKKSKDGMLAANRFILNSACDDTKQELAEMKSTHLDVELSVKALAELQAKTCTTANTGG